MKSLGVKREEVGVGTGFKESCGAFSEGNYKTEENPKLCQTMGKT